MGHKNGGKEKVFIFDFDGTICDSFAAVIAAVNKSAPTFGMQSITACELPRLREQSLGAFFSELGISKLQAPLIVAKVRRELRAVMGDLLPFPGMAEALAACRLQGYRVGILSSNAHANIVAFALKHHLELDFIYGGSSLFGKKRLIKKLLLEQGIARQEAIYVGDETRDIEASQAAGVRVVAVTWGFNSKEVLRRGAPDFLIDTPQELPLLNLN